MMRRANVTAGGIPPVAITGITADSRAVAPGFLFAALPGASIDGRRFIADAVERGAAAVLAPLGTEWPAGVPPRPLIQDAEPRRALARLAAAQAGSQPHTVVAITGTNGKTSTAEFLRQLMARSQPSASLGTLGVIAPGHPGGGGLTTPDPVTLAQTLAALAREGVRFAALEASSHGLDQFRLDGVRLAAAGFTNLTRDHLDYHGDMAAYRAAKLRLFTDLLPPGSPAVATTALDAHSTEALRAARGARRLKLGFVGEDGDLIRLLRAVPHPGGQSLDVLAAGVRRTIDTGAAGAASRRTTPCWPPPSPKPWASPARFDRLATLTGVRGRMELGRHPAPTALAVYVDYAHTPDALERLLAALRPHTAGRLHLVFGAGGDRDRGKRPLMGDAGRPPRRRRHHHRRQSTQRGPGRHPRRHRRRLPRRAGDWRPRPGDCRRA